MLQFTHLFGQPLVECLGWSLVHFLWQGLVLANVLLLLLLTFRRRSANVRYVAACGVLLTMAVCPLATFAWLWGHLDTRHETAGATVEAWLGGSAEPVDHLPSADLTGDHPLAMPPSPIGEPAEATQIARSDRINVPAPTESSVSTLYQKLERAIPWVVLAWLVGVVTCSLRLSLGWMRLRRVKSAGSQAASRWQELAASVAQRLRLSRSVRFLESALVEVPTVVGWLRPIVLLPAVALTGLTPRQLEALLAHELAHIRRNDYLVNLLQTLIETLLFYHPAVWWVSARTRQEREHCCDDLAIRLCGDRIEYVRALASLEELRATASGLAVAAGDGSLLKRVRRLIGSPDTKPGGLQVSLLTLVAVLLIGTMFIAPFVFPADTTADPSQNQQPTETSDEESGETMLLVANWGAVLDEPVVQQLRKLSVEDVTSQDGVETWFVNADKAREIVCAARDRKQFVLVSTSVEWLSEDTVTTNPVGFCTVSGIEQATSSPCSVICQRTADMNVAGSEASVRLQLDLTGQGIRAEQEFDLKKRLAASANVASGQAFVVAVALAPVNGWQSLACRLGYVIVFEAVRVPTARQADYQRVTTCNWWLQQTQAGVAKLLRQAAAWQQRAAARPQKMLDAWTRTLPHGGKVNLVAVGRPRQDPFRWWDAEGQPYAFDWRKWGGSLEQHELVAVLRIWEPPSSVVGYDADRNRRPECPSRLGVDSYPDDWPATPGSQSVIVPLEVLAAQGQPQVSVGFGAGPWPTSQRLALRQEVSLDGQAFYLDDREPYPFDRQEKFAHAVLSWSFLPDREVRLSAVDKAGREHASEGPPEVRSNRLPLLGHTESCHESFQTLPKSELDHFVLKTRPRHWVAFSGFALQPADETWSPVQITVRGSEADQIAFVRAAVQGVPRTPDDFARQFADSLRAAIATRRAPFLSEELLDKVHGDFQSFVAEHRPATLTAEQQQAILDSTTKFVALSVGDYLSFPDALENLKQRLRQAFDRRPLTEEQQRRLAEQREWIREFIRQLPLEPGVWLRLHAEALAGFEELLTDPLWPLLKEPLSDEQFGVFQQKLKERQDLKIHFIVWHIGAALAQTLWPQGNWSTSDGTIWFTFDRAQRGEQPRLPALDAEGQVCVLDVPTLRMEYPPGIGPLTRDQIEALLHGEEANQGDAVGDLGYFQKGDLLAGFRGARLALLDTIDWYTADQLSEQELRRRIHTSGADTIALAKHRPRGPGFFNPNAPFIAVCTGSGRLAVLAVQAFDPTGVTIHIRTRPVNQGGTGVGAEGGSVSNPPAAAERTDHASGSAVVERSLRGEQGVR